MTVSAPQIEATHRVNALFEVHRTPVTRVDHQAVGFLLTVLLVVPVALAVLVHQLPSAAWIAALAMLAQAWVVLRVARGLAGNARLPWISVSVLMLVACAGVAAGIALDAASVAAVGVLQVAVFAGVMLGRMIDRSAWIVPIAIAASASDAQSFSTGLTSTLADHASTASLAQTGAGDVGAAQATSFGLDLLMLPLAVPGGSWAIGSVDVLIAVALVVTGSLLGLSPRRTEAALLAALLTALVIGPPVPLLPFLMLGFVLAHARAIWHASRYSLGRLLRPAT